MPDDEIERWSGFKSWLFTLFSSAPPSNEAIVSFAGVGSGDRLLDIGCGPGASLENALAAGADVAGVDPSPSMVKRASARVPQAEVREGSAESVPFADGGFSHVWTIASFHHWADVDKGIDEALRVLVDEGRFLIVERQLKKGTGHGLTTSDAAAVAQNLEERGFEETKVETMRAGKADYLVITGSKPHR